MKAPLSSRKWRYINYCIIASKLYIAPDSSPVTFSFSSPSHHPSCSLRSPVRSDWGQVRYRSTYLHSRLCPADIFKLHFGCRYLFLRGIIIGSRNLINILWVLNNGSISAIVWITAVFTTSCDQRAKRRKCAKNNPHNLQNGSSRL